jgi:hypothetical protein
MEVDYKQKYLKYKEKYLKLKAQLGGDYGRLYCTIKDCFCEEYKGGKTYDTVTPFIDCINCKHTATSHVSLKDRMVLENINKNPVVRKINETIETFNNQINQLTLEIEKLKENPNPVSRIKISYVAQNKREIVNNNTKNETDLNNYKTLIQQINDPTGNNISYILQDTQLTEDKQKILNLIRELQRLKESYSENLSAEEKGNINRKIAEVNIEYNKIIISQQTGGGRGKCIVRTQYFDNKHGKYKTNICNCGGFVLCKLAYCDIPNIDTTELCKRDGCGHTFAEHN